MLPLGIASRAHGVRGEIRILTELDPRYLKEVATRRTLCAEKYIYPTA